MMTTDFESIRQRVVIFLKMVWIPMTTIRWMTTRGVSVDAMGDGAREMA